MRKIPRIIFVTMVLLAIASPAFAWALNQPTPPSNILKLAVGSTTRFCETAQNMVGDAETIKLRLEAIKNQDYVKFAKTNDDDEVQGSSVMMLTIPYGENKKPWCVDITVPADAAAGSENEIIIKASKQEQQAEGQVRFTTGQLAKIFVQVKSSGASEQLKPPTAEGQVTNETQGIVNDLQHSANSTAEPAENAATMLYVVLAIVSVIIVLCIAVVLKKTGVFT